MKTFFFSLLVLATVSHAIADVPEIRAKSVTCQELQDAVKNYKQVTVVYRPVLFLKRLTVSDELECSSMQIKTQAIFKTSEGTSCSAGFFCEEREVVVVHRDPMPGRIPDYRPYPTPHPHPIPDHHEPRGPHYNPRPDGHHAPSAPHGEHYNPRPGGCHGRRC